MPFQPKTQPKGRNFTYLEDPGIYIYISGRYILRDPFDPRGISNVPGPRRGTTATTRGGTGGEQEKGSDPKKVALLFVWVWVVVATFV